MPCTVCYDDKHNKRTCPFQLKAPIGVDLSLVPAVTESEYAALISSKRVCSACGECGHNKRTCLLMAPVKQKKCSVCDELGHNSRTCNLKCQPCADQVARSFCFAGMTAEQAVRMTKILECASIYGETEEYPQFVESPPVQRKTENITFANGESVTLDLGPVA